MSNGQIRLPLTQGRRQASVLRCERPGGAAGRILPQDDVGARTAGHWGAWPRADPSPRAVFATPWVLCGRAVTCRGEQCVLQGVRLCKAFPPAEAERISCQHLVSVQSLCSVSLQGDRELPALRSMHQPQEDDYRRLRCH